MLFIVPFLFFIAFITFAAYGIVGVQFVMSKDTRRKLPEPPQRPKAKVVRAPKTLNLEVPKTKKFYIDLNGRLIELLPSEVAKAKRDGYKVVSK